MRIIGEPPLPGDWPDVRTDVPAPAPHEVFVEEGTVLLRSPEVIAHGLVTGIPWSIHAWKTGPAPGAKWWDVMRPVGWQMEFGLGADGFFGGGGVHVRVPEGHFVTASGHFFGRFPHVISWVGVVADDIAHLEVHLADGQMRQIPLHDGPRDLGRFFWLFPPRGLRPEIVTFDREEHALERVTLPEFDVAPESNAGTSVNPTGWRDGTPPPGWPPEEHDFAAGEGPRREDDFLLHIAPFPIYVLPPEHWSGVVFLSGHGGQGEHASYVPARIEFEYLDRVGNPDRGLQIVNVDPDEEDRLENFYPAHREPAGVWWFDAGDDAAYLPQLPGRFVDQRQITGERGDLGGARRYLGRERFAVDGIDTDYERWEYRDYPRLVEIRFRLPGVAVRVESWNLDLETTVALARRLERLELDSDLLRRMKEATAAAGTAWDRWLRQQNPDG
jgi:hypothetical protein